MTFSQEEWEEYEIKTKRVLISKEQKQIKKEEDVETRREIPAEIVLHGYHIEL